MWVCHLFEVFKHLAWSHILCETSAIDNLYSIRNFSFRLLIIFHCNGSYTPFNQSSAQFPTLSYKPKIWQPFLMHREILRVKNKGVVRLCILVDTHTCRVCLCVPLHNKKVVWLVYMHPFILCPLIIILFNIKYNYIMLLLMLLGPIASSPPWI